MLAELFAELQRRALEVDCIIVRDSEDAGQVNVYYQLESLGIVADNGILITCPGYTDDPKRNEAYHRMQSLINEVKEYVRAYQNGYYPAYAEMPEGYLTLTNYNRIFLAATKLQGGGYQFVTWELEKGKMSFCDGRYTTDYKAAKRNFAQRSGLVHKSELFSPPELQAIQKAVEYTLEYRTDNEFDFSKLLQGISLKLEDALPEPEIQKQEKNGFEQSM